VKLSFKAYTYFECSALQCTEPHKRKEKSYERLSSTRKLVEIVEDICKKTENICLDNSPSYNEYIVRLVFGDSHSAGVN
jgi:hypothetical protein